MTMSSVEHQKNLVQQEACTILDYELEIPVFALALCA